MKARELRYNDWVFVDRLGYAVQVKAITRKKIGYHMKGNMTRLHYAQLHEISPIVTTIDHLRINNFEVIDEYTAKGWGNIIKLGKHHEFCFIGHEDRPILFMYINELQHLLDDIGLVELSENFICEA